MNTYIQLIVTAICLQYILVSGLPVENDDDDEPQPDIPFKTPFSKKDHLTYDFAYNVRDDDTGAAYSQRETREGKKTTGEYRVSLPDGRIQVVSYIADEKGYRAKVSYEPQESKSNKEESIPSKSANESVGKSSSNHNHQTTKRPRVHKRPINRPKLRNPKITAKPSPYVPPEYLDHIHATARPPYFQPQPPRYKYHVPENHYLSRHKDIYPQSPYSRPLHSTTKRGKAFQPPHITTPSLPVTEETKPSTTKKIIEELPTTPPPEKLIQHKIKLPAVTHSSIKSSLFFEVKKELIEKENSGKEHSDIDIPEKDKTVLSTDSGKSIESFPTIFRWKTNPENANVTDFSKKTQDIETTTILSSRERPAPKNFAEEQSETSSSSVPEKSKLITTLKPGPKQKAKSLSFVTTHSSKSLYTPKPPAFSETPPPLKLATKLTPKTGVSTKSPTTQTPSTTIKPKKRPTQIHHHKPPHPTVTPFYHRSSTPYPHHPSISRPPYHPSTRYPAHHSSPTYHPHHSSPKYSPHPTYLPHHSSPKYPPHPPSPAPYHHSTPYPHYPSPTPHYPRPTHAPKYHHPSYPPLHLQHPRHPVHPQMPFPVPFIMPQYGPLFYNPYFEKSYNGPKPKSTTKQPKTPKTEKNKQPDKS